MLKMLQPFKSPDSYGIYHALLQAGMYGPVDIPHGTTIQSQFSLWSDTIYVDDH